MIAVYATLYLPLVAAAFVYRSFSWAERISRSVVSQSMQASVIDKPYFMVLSVPVFFWFPASRLLSSIMPMMLLFPSIR